MPDKMSWNNFRALKHRVRKYLITGIPQANRSNPLSDIIRSWNGKSSNYLLYYMYKGAEYFNTAFDFRSSDHTRVARYDKYQRDAFEYS